MSRDRRQLHQNSESCAGQSESAVRKYGGSVGQADVKGQQNGLV